jgi:hypothetical protein
MRTSLKVFLVMGFLTSIASGSRAQTPADVLAHNSAVTFFGVDYSKCKGVMLGATAIEMRDKYFPAINSLLLVEEDKFSIKKALVKSDVTNTLTDVSRLNATLDVGNFDVYSSKEVTPMDPNVISAMVQQYNLQDKKGIGLVFIAESLDKTKAVGTYYLVYFSMPDGKVILSERVSGLSKGFGLRNYWANTIYSILESDLQKKLEKKYLPQKPR